MLAILSWCVIAVVYVLAQRPTIDDFFRAFSDEWVRLDPDLAVVARDFSGDEQARLDRQLRPWTNEYFERRREVAKRGLVALRRFSEAELSAEDRISFQVLAWQLQSVIDEEKYQRLNYPLEPQNGADVDLVSNFTVWQPVKNGPEADNYVAQLEFTTKC